MFKFLSDDINYWIHHFCCIWAEIQFICRSSISYKGIILSQWDRRKNDFKFSYQSCKNYFFYLSLFISILDIELLCRFLLGLFRSLNSIFDVINSWLFIFIHWSDEIENRIRSKWLLLFASFFFIIRSDSSRQDVFQFYMIWVKKGPLLSNISKAFRNVYFLRDLIIVICHASEKQLALFLL